MDDTAYQRFFTRPTQTYHRQYEALRAVFVDGRSQKEVAAEFGFRYSSLRQLVYEFRQDCDTGREASESPFFEASTSSGLSNVPTKTCHHQSLIDSSWYSRTRNRCVSEPERQVCSCSCRCWPN
jgi:hypothetical protein